MTYGTTITGTAQISDARTGIGLRSAPVQLCTKSAPATTYTCARATTDAYGKLIYRVRAAATTTLFVTHPGTVTTTPSVSAALIYPVIPKVSLRASRAQLAVTAAPAARQRVTLDRWDGRAWKAVAAGTTGASGAVTFTRLSTAYYRVRVPASRSLTGAATPYVLVRR